MTITFCTPTYNRALLLPRLYQSLVSQSNLNFEWIIVDDGSTDETEQLVKKWIQKQDIPIRYFKQQNGGKHRAVNRGLKEAKGELFLIVDSDDWLTADAVEWIIHNATPIMSDSTLAGIAGIRISPNGKPIAKGLPDVPMDCSAVSIRVDKKVTGDLVEVFKTEVFRKFPFPEFEGEKFCPEALVWNRITEDLKIRYFNKGFYLCEYLPGGLTSKITKIRRESPNATMTYYAELYHSSIPLKWKIRTAINFWRFALAPYRAEFKMLSPLSLLCAIPGTILKFKERNRVK